MKDQLNKLHQFQERYELIFACTSLFTLVLGIIMQNLHYTALSNDIFLLTYLVGGVFKLISAIKHLVYEKKLSVEVLMVLAALGAAFINSWEEGAVLIVIFSMSGALETLTLKKNKRAIDSLMKLQPEVATLYDGEDEIVVHVKDLSIDQLILIKPGESVPIDSKIIKGSSSFNESAITGESMPVMKGKGDNIFAGTLNGNSVVIAEVTHTSQDTLLGKIVTLIEQAQGEKPPTQIWIEKVEDIYVKIALLATIILLFTPHYLLGWTWEETMYRAIVFLVVSSPCAVVASIMPATLAAITNVARHGVLCKGGIFMEQLANVEVIAFDKTGTLTNGVPTVVDSFYIPLEEQQLKFIQSFILSTEKQVNHPLAQAIVKSLETVPSIQTDSIEIEDVPGSGVYGKFEDKQIKIGKEEWMNETQIFKIHSMHPIETMHPSATPVYVELDGTVVAVFAIEDPIREESKNALLTLASQNIQTVMLTGDHERVASHISRELALSSYKSRCLPNTKLEYLKELKKNYKVTAMVGDGINDAPALAHATIGIAMGEGTDVAMETADIVLMKNDLSKLPYAITLSKKLKKIVVQNLVFSLSIILLLVISNFFQIVNLPFGVFAHEGSTLFVILNGLRLLK